MRGISPTPFSNHLPPTVLQTKIIFVYIKIAICLCRGEYLYLAQGSTVGCETSSPEFVFAGIVFVRHRVRPTSSSPANVFVRYVFVRSCSSDRVRPTSSSPEFVFARSCSPEFVFAGVRVRRSSCSPEFVFAGVRVRTIFTRCCNTKFATKWIHRRSFFLTGFVQ